MHAPSRDAAANEALAYRPFVDGLRAVSILAVILYHSGVPGFSGGFVGVDIFFVISGFLIIGQIVDGVERGTFTLGGFWARRAWRILPPFVLVLVASLVGAIFVLSLPNELRDLAKQATGAATMSINHLFLGQQGYFDTSADRKIFLHFWSLAVEEQFYLAAPLLIAGTWLAGRALHVAPSAWKRALAGLAFAVFVTSLVGCLYWSSGPNDRNYGFYLAPLRAWEFVAGGAMIVIVGPARRLSRALRDGMALLGLSLIAIAVWSFSPDLVYPGWRAIVPVAGACAIILAGMSGSAGSVVLVLSSRPAVAIGLVSYAWYLWHWPLLAFARIRSSGETTVAEALLLCALALGLAAATYLIVERPIRDLRRAGKLSISWKPVYASVALCVLLAIAGRQSMDAFARHYGGYLPADYYPIARSIEPVCDLRTASTPQQCLEFAAERPFGLLMGDSQVLVPRDSLVKAATAGGFATISQVSPGCVALLGVHVFASDSSMEEACVAMGKTGPSFVSQLKASGGDIQFALLHSQWPSYIAGDPTVGIGEIGSSEHAADQKALFESSLRSTLNSLKDKGIQRILVIGPTPVLPNLVPNCLALADRVGRDRTISCGVPRADAEKIANPVRALLRSASAGIDGVRYIDAIDDFCDAQWCRPFAGDAILYIDNFHLADSGMQRIIDGHRKDFAWLFGAGPNP